MPTSLKIRQGLGPLGDVLIPVLAASGGTCYYDQGTVMVTTVGAGGSGYCHCHHYCQGVIMSLVASQQPT